MTEYTPFAFWPDTFMCPLSEVEEMMSPPTARSNLFEIVYVYEYDYAGQPYKWLTQFQYDKGG